MKKILLRLLAIIILAVLAVLARNYTTQQTELPPSEVVKLGIIPVYFDESSLTPLVGVNEAGEEVAPALPTTSEMMTEVTLSDGKIGTLLDYYTETVNLWRIVQSSYFLPEVELVFAKQGCVSSTTSFDGPSEAFLQAEKEINAEGVQSIVYVPCPTDETRLLRGREQLRTALNDLRYLQSEELFTGEGTIEGQPQETTLDNPMQQNVEPDIIEHGGTGNATRNMEFVGLEPNEDGVDITKTSVLLQTPNGFPKIHLLIPYSLWTRQLHDLAVGASAMIDRTALYLFSGEVTYLDAAMGNRYYEATSIDQFTTGMRGRVKTTTSQFCYGNICYKIKEACIEACKRDNAGARCIAAPCDFSNMCEEEDFCGEITERTKEEVDAQLDSRNYCEKDEDCEAFYGECPFGCRQVLNKQFVQPAQQLIKNYLTISAAKGEPQCVYGCMALDDAVIQCGPAGTPNVGKCQIIRE